ncbi:MAG TPA: efflux RND transporter periplasmic adaptor subunit [Armatimonadota bacterium]|nr:efflux RND transporter periplasmic adaptor subunit [Armatimonadota bacterium]HOM81237.1 efflux RND transporter periplasmic adaptor subunit [Armatimonadota bacterium]HPO73600.1 efflux RND transporter periplasmic adaptor subunit [Armatimonadota bacterium]HPT96734.1 efflux RND transporter periplasmic adaptor subunit [Armatimonadota bacterium]
MPVKLAPVQRQTLVERVRLVGVIAAERKATVAAQMPGRVVSVAVQEGDAVAAGDLLVSLFDGDARMRVAAAEAEVRRARARMQSARTDTQIVSTEAHTTEAQAAEDLRIAEARLEQARSELRLAEERSGGEVAVAKAELEAAQSQLRLLQAGSRSEEVERARAEVEGAKVAVASARRDADQAKRDWERKRDLGERDFIPRRDVENAERDWQQAKAEVALAESRLRNLEAALRQLEAGPRPEEVAQARAQVQAAEERLRNATRNDALLAQKRQEIAAAQAQVNRARKALEAARAADHRVRKSEHETRVVRSELEAAEANLRLARADLEKLQIYAPMAATVASRDVNPGEMIQPGQALLTLIDTRSLYLNATVSDHDVSRIRVGQPVEVRFEALKGRVFPGQVQEILPPTSPQERNFHAKIRLERREPSIQTGMLATGSGIVARHQNVLTIPEAAFLASAPDSHEGTVYVVEDGVARRRSVGVAARIDGMWVVREGLKEGEQVVVDGQAMLKDGRPVRVR